MACEFILKSSLLVDTITGTFYTRGFVKLYKTRISVQRVDKPKSLT